MRTFDDICKSAEAVKNDMDKLKELYEYVKKNRMSYSVSHYEFMLEHINSLGKTLKYENLKEKIKERLKDDD